mmetsp:Transcript_2860/g.4553  ORF Transcript_2860/g.4553 Transcript_2860/m.4553 type:complete len:207 (+) Transcript_2860:368-988(+)
MAPLIDDTPVSYDINMIQSTADSANDQIMIDATKTLSVPHRHVSFCESITESEVLNRHDYTDQELRATWYSRTELRRIKEQVRDEAKLLEAGILTESVDVSTRGLESKTREGLRRKRENRMNANSAIFFELEGQEENGVVDDEAIADVYYAYSEHCQVTAHMLGMRDSILAKEALEHIKTDFIAAPYFCRAIINLPRSESFVSSAA